MKLAFGSRKHPLILVLALAFIVLSLLSLWYYQYQEKTQKNKLYKDLSIITQLKVDQIGLWKKEQQAKAAAMQ